LDRTKLREFRFPMVVQWDCVDDVSRDLCRCADRDLQETLLERPVGLHAIPKA
jgi:hypothetical protein